MNTGHLLYTQTADKRGMFTGAQHLQGVKLGVHIVKVTAGAHDIAMSFPRTFALSRRATSLRTFPAVPRPLACKPMRCPIGTPHLFPFAWLFRGDDVRIAR